jgi:hypothetical protein
MMTKEPIISNSRLKNTWFCCSMPDMSPPPPPPASPPAVEPSACSDRNDPGDSRLKRC